jgi:general secretion pathway protein D
MLKYLTAMAILLLLPVSSFSMDFEITDGDLTDLVTYISKHTGQNIVVQGDADFPITAVCPSLPPEKYIKFLETVVVANGGVMTVDDGIHTVTMIKTEDEPKEEVEPDVVAFYHCNHVTPESLMSVLPQGVKYSTYGNDILVQGQPEQVNIAMSVLPQLDEPQQQYVIEAVIFEVRQSDLENVDYSIDLTTSDVFSRLTDVFSGLSPLAFPSGFSAGITTPDFDVVIQAIESSTDASMLSTPRVVLADRRRGHITVGQNLPFLTGRYEDSESETPFQTIERKDVGVTLSVLPQSINDELVQLVVTQSASSVNTSVVASDIVTNSRSLTTDVVVQVGDYVYLGGLSDKTEEEVLTQVPFLSSIPFLGDWFFTSRKTETVNRNLNILFRVTTSA